MSSFLKWMIGLGILFAFSIIGFYKSFYPTEHFKERRLPVLASPHMLSDTIKSKEIPVFLQSNLEVKKESFNLLLLGIDARSSENSRTDVIMILNINPKQKKVSIVSIPRDTRVYIKNIGYTKINHAHIVGEITDGIEGGTKSSFQTVSNFCRCTINYYVKTNFSGFISIIDEIGGINVNLQEPVTLTSSDTILSKGKHHLSGETALAFVRERYSLPDGDQDRQQNQGLVLKALAQEVLTSKNIKKIPTLIKQVKEEMLNTNLSENDVISLAWIFKEIENKDIEYIQIPGKSSSMMDPLVKKKLYYWLADEEELLKISEEILNK